MVANSHSSTKLCPALNVHFRVDRNGENESVRKGDEVMWRIFTQLRRPSNDNNEIRHGRILVSRSFQISFSVLIISSDRFLI